jgi:hypothetical protein
MESLGWGYLVKTGAKMSLAGVPGDPEETQLLWEAKSEETHSQLFSKPHPTSHQGSTAGRAETTAKPRSGEGIEPRAQKTPTSVTLLLL